MVKASESFDCWFNLKILNLIGQFLNFNRIHRILSHSGELQLEPTRLGIASTSKHARTDQQTLLLWKHWRHLFHNKDARVWPECETWKKIDPNESSPEKNASTGHSEELIRSVYFAGFTLHTWCVYIYIKYIILTYINYMYIYIYIHIHIQEEIQNK